MIRSIEKKISFVIVAGIFCPIEAMKQPIFVDIFKNVASYQLVLKITRDEVIFKYYKILYLKLCDIENNNSNNNNNN